MSKKFGWGSLFYSSSQRKYKELEKRRIAREEEKEKKKIEDE